MKTFKMSITRSRLLRITIIAYFRNWNNHSASTNEIRLELWVLGQKIFALQFPRLSPKFWKIVDFKSAISPLLELQMRWFFFWNYVFLKEEFRYATYFSWIYTKSFKNLCKIRFPILPLLFSKKKNFPLAPRKVL